MRVAPLWFIVVALLYYCPFVIILYLVIPLLSNIPNVSLCPLARSFPLLLVRSLTYSIKLYFSLARERREALYTLLLAFCIYLPFVLHDI